MKQYDPSQFDILLKYSDTYIGVVKNQPYRPEIGDLLKTEDDSVWYEIIGFPENVKPITPRSWVVQLLHWEDEIWGGNKDE